MLSDDFLAARQSMMQATFECSDRKADGAYVFIDFNNSFIGTFVLMDGHIREAVGLVDDVSDLHRKLTDGFFVLENCGFSQMWMGETIGVQDDTFAVMPYGDIPDFHATYEAFKDAVKRGRFGYIPAI